MKQLGYMSAYKHVNVRFQKSQVAAHSRQLESSGFYITSIKMEPDHGPGDSSYVDFFMYSIPF